MPRATYHNSEELRIDLKDPKTIYRPANVLEGRVLFNPKDKCAVDNITVCLYGRAKVKIIQSHGESQSIYRSRAVLFYKEQALYSGQREMFESGTYEWPFHFTLPGHTEARVQQDEKFKLKAPFPGTGDDEGLPPQPPPNSYYHGVFGRQAFGHVEYVLTVYFGDKPDPRKLRSPKGLYATRPINFQPYSTPNPLREYRLTSHSQELTADRPRFLSIGHRGEPPLGFTVHARFPTVIQVNHSDPIPFYLHVTIDPQRNPHFNTRVNDAETANAPIIPQLYLDTARITLHATTVVRASTGLGYTRDCRTGHIELVNTTEHSFGMPLLLNPNKPTDSATESFEPSCPVESQSTYLQRPDSSSSEHTLKLGHIFDLRIPNPAVLSKKMHERPLCPSFATYNIARYYRLSWSLLFTLGNPKGPSVWYSTDDIRPARKDGSGPSTGFAGLGLFAVDEGVGVAINGRLSGEEINVNRKGWVKIHVLPGPESDIDGLPGDVDEEIEDDEEERDEKEGLKYSPDIKENASTGTTREVDSPEINQTENARRRGSRFAFWRRSAASTTDPSSNTATSIASRRSTDGKPKMTKAEEAAEDRRRREEEEEEEEQEHEAGMRPPYRAEDDWDRDGGGSGRDLGQRSRQDHGAPPPYEA